MNCIIHVSAVEFVLNCDEMLRHLLNWHMNIILKVEVFNCFVVSASLFACKTVEVKRVNSASRGGLSVSVSVVMLYV